VLNDIRGSSQETKKEIKDGSSFQSNSTVWKSCQSEVEVKDELTC
jgi:hypothetical protein